MELSLCKCIGKYDCKKHSKNIEIKNEITLIDEKPKYQKIEIIKRKFTKELDMQLN